MVKGILCLICTTGVGCRQNAFDTESELWSYIKDRDNGYSFEKQMGDVNYILSYRPIDLLVCQEINGSVNREKIDGMRTKYGNYIYFNLTMSVENQEILNSQIGNRQAFGAMVNQLAFGMGQKIHLISQKRDTVPMVDYIYPRMYGMGNGTELLLVYPRDKELMRGEYFHLRVQDLGFGTGEVGFKIPTKSLKDEPQLEFANQQKSL